MGLPELLGRWTGLGATLGFAIVVMLAMWRFEREVFSTYRDEVDRLTGRLDHLEQRNTELEAANRALAAQVQSLRAIVVRLGGDPDGWPTWPTD